MRLERVRTHAKVVPPSASPSMGHEAECKHMSMIAIAMFLIAAVLALVLLLLGKEGRRAQLRVNGVLIADVDRGERLMTVLAGQGIQLPGTCGGQGACALCKCQVLSGVGAIGVQEAPYFNEAAVRDHWRLACQVVVKGDVSVRVPDELLPKGPRPDQ